MIDRRGALKSIGVGTAAAWLGPLAVGRHGFAQPIATTRRKAMPFPLDAIRLLDGEFSRAQERNARYLSTLDADRLLHAFRVNAGLEPKAPIYGGWESQEPWVEIRCHGHTLGHYLSACSMHYAATGEEAFKARVHYVVTELAECQRAGTTGLICAFPDGAAQLERSVRGEKFLGVPWYTMHKVYAGLRDAHLFAGSAPALEVLVALSDWAWRATEPLSDAAMQTLLDREHGGMNEIFADVYALTRDRRYLRLAERFSHRALLDPLVEGKDVLDGLHSNTQIPKVIGFSRLHELTGNERYRRAARVFWDRVVRARSFVTGGNGDLEHFFPPNEFAKRLSSAKTMETCCTHNLLKLTRKLFGDEANAAFADYYERALFNGILASQDPQSGMMTYFQATRPGYVKLYCTPFDSFWCCTGSGIENHAKYGDSIYFHDGDVLFVNLFLASTLHWRERGLTFTQSTRFPDEERSTLAFELETPTRLALRLRHPSWCREAVVTINGRRRSVSRRPGSYMTIERQWRTGDVVEVHVPMHLHVEPLPGDANMVAALYGPIVLAGRMGTHGLAPGADLIVNERLSGTMLNEPTPVPAFAGRPSQFVRAFTRADRPLHFVVRGFEESRAVEFMPYYRIAHERYNLYWKMIDSTA
jgi:uncharacterized protein